MKKKVIVEVEVIVEGDDKESFDYWLNELKRQVWKHGISTSKWGSNGCFRQFSRSKLKNVRTHVSQSRIK